MTIPFTPSSLAERWHCSARHIRNLVHKGDLPAFRIGSMVRIPAAAVEEIERQAVAGDFARVTIEGEAWIKDPPLVKAAPDMLTALQGALVIADTLPIPQDASKEFYQAIDKRRQAILDAMEKATGTRNRRTLRESKK